MPPKSFPKPILALLDDYSSTGENLKTSSKADVYFYRHPTKPGLFVKQLKPDGAPREADLNREQTALAWLQGRLKVPQLMGYHYDDGIETMVTQQVPGWPASDDQAKDDVPMLIELLAQGLREVHAVALENCPLDCRVDAGLARVEQWFERGVMGLQDLPEAIRKTNLHASLDAIRRLQPEYEDVVFTHGDYCLPNILVERDHLTGFIDLGYAGLGDRYRDFVSADYSIRRNLGDEWVPAFWEEYGIDIDPEKFAFYQLLHDLI